MPSAMIHLLIAYEVDPNAPDLFWFGNFAPDYTDLRPFKDQIHFRNEPRRLEALARFKETIDMNNPFEAGWLLHLFADACWDELKIPTFQQKYEPILGSQHWFVKYREEINLASFYLYHHIEWAPQIWNRILNADLSSVSMRLPITADESAVYRARVHKRHSESDLNSVSQVYDEKQIIKFSKNTALKFTEWCKR